ncbi:hypothetical protein EC501_01220 [Lysinibacillus halotolerans]|uniref:Uncharacterized protein n=1 Tax=Lysinibacillus halotolerans TaxID=1368476 RepID=A0A3M8HIX5_9BACI|nr:hypothetical protein EC501_01220 [Lysinibacillus halotolerans]
MKKQKNNVESLQKIIIEQKKKEIDLGEKIISMLIKEKKLLNSHKKLVKKYEALRNSKLGKLTYAYWKFKKRIMMRG